MSEKSRERRIGAASTRVDATDAPEGAAVVRHEEELHVGKTSENVGAARVRKHVETGRVEEVVPRTVEHIDDVERMPPNEHDSGQVETLADGSVSIPVLEEELVISKRTVVRERVVVRKRTETEHRRIEAELRKERVEIDAEGDVEVAEPEDEASG